MPNKKQTQKLSNWNKAWRVALAIAVPLGGGLIHHLAFYARCYEQIQ